MLPRYRYVCLSIKYILFRKRAEGWEQKFICGIQEDEQVLWREIMNSEELILRDLTKPQHPPPESLRALANTFCFDGSMPPNKKDAIVKELLKYRLIDIFAYTGNGMEGLDNSIVEVPRQYVVWAAPQLVCLIFIFSSI